MPVISVGNLTWGGNGKTPMVEFIARWLLDFGISPLILTRVLFLLCFLPSFNIVVSFFCGAVVKEVHRCLDILKCHKLQL